MKNQKFWLLILTAAIIIRLIYLLLTPIGQTPDEIFIFRRIWNTVLNLTNPALITDHTTNYPNNEYYYPPLYFVLSAIFIKLILLFQNLPSTFAQAYTAFYFPLRVLSLSFSIASLILIWKIINKLKLDSSLKLAIYTFICLIPTFANFSIYPNHNTLLFFFITFFVYLLTTYQQDSLNLKKAAILGTIFGLAILTKLDAVIIFPAFLTYTALSKNDILPLHGRTGYPKISRLSFLPDSSSPMEGRSILRRENKKLKTFFKYLAIFSIFSLITGGWWVVWNYFKIGWFYNRDLFQAAIQNYLLPFSFPHYATLVLSSTLVTFFATFGVYNHIFLHPIAYQIIILSALAGIAGIFKSKFHQIINSSINLKKIIYSLSLSFLANIYLSLYVNFNYVYQAQGRYFFPSLIFLSFIIVLGLSTHIKKRQLYLLPVIIFIFWLFFNLWSLNCIFNSFHNLNIFPILTCYS